MPTDDAKGPKGWFPTGYEHIESWVTEVQKKIAEIDTAISNLPPDKGPYPSPRPTDEIPRMLPPSRQSVIDWYDNEKIKLKEGVRTKINETTKDADPKTAKKIEEKAEFLMYEKNVFRDLPKSDLDKLSREEKNSQKGFDYMTAIYFTSGDYPEKDALVKEIDGGKNSAAIILWDIPDPMHYFNDILDSYHNEPSGYDEKMKLYQENRDDIERGDD